MRRGRLRLVPVALLAVTSLVGCTTGADDDGPVQGAPAPPEMPFAACAAQPDAAAGGGELLPSLAFDCLGGGELDLSRALERPTVVNLWASWCGPCREELPVIQEFAEQAAGEVDVVGVISRDGARQASSFAAEAGVSFPGAFDERGQLMDQLGIRGLPYTYFLSADGAVSYVRPGPIATAEELHGLVAEHLGVQP